MKEKLVKVTYRSAVSLITGFLFIFLMTSCGAGRTGIVNSYEELEQLVDTQQFEIENDWAMPIGGDRVNLIGNSNFIRFKGDSVDIFLPYFGVRHTGGNYGGDGGIEYKGLAKDLEIKKQQDKNRIVLEFEGDQSSENLDFMITIFSNGSTNTSVNSSERSSISYQGNIKSSANNEEE